MNFQAGVNMLMSLCGVIVIAALFLFGRRVGSGKNRAKVWAMGIFKRYGLIQTARMIGLILLLATFSALTLFYA